MCALQVLWGLDEPFLLLSTSSALGGVAVICYLLWFLYKFAFFLMQGMNMLACVSVLPA